MMQSQRVPESPLENEISPSRMAQNNHMTQPLARPSLQKKIRDKISAAQNYKHTIKSKKFGECEYRFGDPLGETLT